MIHQSKPRETAARNTSPPTTPPAMAPASLLTFDVDAEVVEDAIGAVMEKSTALALAWLVEEAVEIDGTAVVFALNAS